MNPKKIVHPTNLYSTMNWNNYINGFILYMKLERSFSEHTIEAYARDIRALVCFLEEQNYTIAPKDLTLTHLQAFIHSLHEMELSAPSQSRLLSGIKAFFRYLMIENVVEEDPSELLIRPQQGKHLPEILSFEEILKIFAAVDQSTNYGVRNIAILEVLYACGLRVSELISLQIPHIFWDEEFISVIGKGNKQRFIPINTQALKLIRIYLEQIRSSITPKHNSENILFLNRNGGKMTRQMINHIVKTSAKDAGITKNVYPHIFRHSFASELVNNGADLRAVQEMLGHVSITTTEIYAHLDALNLKETLLLYHPFYQKK